MDERRHRFAAVLAPGRQPHEATGSRPSPAIVAGRFVARVIVPLRRAQKDRAGALRRQPRLDACPPCCPPATGRPTTGEDRRLPRLHDRAGARTGAGYLLRGVRPRRLGGMQARVARLVPACPRPVQDRATEQGRLLPRSRTASGALLPARSSCGCERSWPRRTARAPPGHALLAEKAAARPTTGRPLPLECRRRPALAPPGAAFFAIRGNGVACA